MPLVSIVIPTYNRAGDLKRALQSVIAQTFQDWEALIIDNHSTDNTDEVIAGFKDSRVKTFKIYNNGIIAASRNLGIKEAQGKYIALLDSDDWWMPKKLEQSVYYLEQGNDVVYHELYVVRKNNQKLFFKTTPTRTFTKPVFVDLMIHGSGMSNSSIVVRTDYFRKVGGIAEDFALVAAEDYDTWLRISKLTEKFFMIPEALGYYWAGGGNMTNPERIFRYTEALQTRYQKEIKDYGLEGKIYWSTYARGRAFFLQKNFEMAKKELSLLVFKAVPLFIFLKSRFMLLMIAKER